MLFDSVKINENHNEKYVQKKVVHKLKMATPSKIFLGINPLQFLRWSQLNHT
jgi:hypothetical protein